MRKWRGRKGEGEERLERMLLDVRGMAQVEGSCAWFKAMLETVMENKLRAGADCSCGLWELGEKEGRIIGAALASALATTLTAEAAVDEWVCRFPALGEFEGENPWFRR